MKRAAGVDLRQQVVRRVPAELLADLLDSVGNWRAVLDTGLRLALHVLRAEQGLIFGANYHPAGQGVGSRGGLLRSYERLRGLLGGADFAYYSLPEFSAIASGDGPVVGMAGRIHTACANFVLGVERPDSPFSFDEQSAMRAVMKLLQNPLQCTAEIMAFRGEVNNNNKLNVTQLPLQDLEPFPNLREIEKLLIQAAIERARNNKAKAAAFLGVTREGLRKKMVRFGLAV